MSNNTDKMGKLEKRLEAVEGAIRWICQIVCTSSYNLGLVWFRAEELKSYMELWGKKLKAIQKKIGTSQTVEEALDITSKFYEEISDYVSARKVDTADKAMEIAHSFIKKYSPVALPLKAEKEGDVWSVDIDVGALAVKIAKVKIDARTGDIMSYDIPEKK